MGNLDPGVFFEMVYVRITIKQAEESEFRLSVDDVRASISPILSQNNQHLQQYLDVLTSHDAMNNSPDFFSYSASELVSEFSARYILLTDLPSLVPRVALYPWIYE